MKLTYSLAAFFFVFSALGWAQEETETQREPGHTNQSKFRQMYQEFATPNTYRSASGAPGPDYYQQQADYKMDITLDDKNARLYGEETITYYNNSPDDLEYLWVQLDQNVRAWDSKSPLRDGDGVPLAYRTSSFAGQYFTEPFDGGFKIEYVRDAQGNPLSYTVNQTMMRVNIPEPLKSGDHLSFSIKWWYNIPDHTVKILSPNGGL